MVTEVSILGSTGSIGTQTIDVCQKHNIKVIGISANENIDLLTKQALSLNPKYACICNEDKYKLLKENLKGTKIQVLTGTEGLLKVASCAKTTVNALVGISGLQPTIYAIKNKINVALANKETLVVGGKLITSLAKENNVSILPVDSEHSAIFQCLQGGTKAVKQIILTASGGPFYNQTDLSNVTLSQALKHPNWNMGAKVTIDSATLMNKGLEYIEAYWLFNQVPIKIVVHPQSIVHSMIEYQDNSVIAQMGSPDMRLPIQYALTYPDRLPCDAPQLNLVG
ncbi:MAG: 1-deoxy-D-xylulose-5-phosphate reductoisomerase, partial [Oscillospiraceae bacterium]